jgi:hypothetical protein
MLYSTKALRAILNFTPGGHSLILGAKLRMGLWRCSRLERFFNLEEKLFLKMH